MTHLKIRSPSNGHFFSKKNKVCIYDKLYITFNEIVFRQINAKCQLLRSFLLLTWLNYENKKIAENIFIDR